MIDEEKPSPLRLSDAQADDFDRQKRIPGWEQETLKNANVLLVGAGALGNEVCKNLAQCGTGNITVIDPDVIERTNLNRCVYFGRTDIGEPKAPTLAERVRISFPETLISGLPYRFEDIDEHYSIANADLVVSCVDSIDVRLTINRSCAYYLKPLVDGGTSGLHGRVQTVVPPGDVCLDCRWRQIAQEQRMERYRCGVELAWFDRPEPAVSVTTSVVGAVQSMEAVKVLKMMSSENNDAQGRFETLRNKMWTIDLATNLSQVIGISKDSACPSHDYHR